METVRTPFQGLRNIIRFNRHFYLFSLGGLFVMLCLSVYFPGTTGYCFLLFGVLSAGVILISLGISFYIYDRSGLYRLDWLNNVEIPPTGNLVNIHAGFDETSGLLKQKFGNASWTVFDFYDPLVHTEISIKRARKAYPAFPGTYKTSTSHLPVRDQTIDIVFILFSAHEIRNTSERSAFFKEIHRILKPSGQVVLMEHLRDTANFLAYNIGSFHFFSQASWKQTFREAHFSIGMKIKYTPFISTFILQKNGTPS